MNKYESVIIINPNLEDKQRKELITKVETLINNMVKLLKLKKWVKRN